MGVKEQVTRYWSLMGECVQGFWYWDLGLDQWPSSFSEGIGILDAAAAFDNFRK